MKRGLKYGNDGDPVKNLEHLDDGLTTFIHNPITILWEQISPPLFLIYY